MAKGTLFGKPKDEVVKRPGALTKKAQSAGKSIPQYCSNPNLDTRTKRQCALAAQFRSWKK